MATQVADMLKQLSTHRRSFAAFRHRRAAKRAQAQLLAQRLDDDFSSSSSSHIHASSRHSKKFNTVQSKRYLIPGTKWLQWCEREQVMRDILSDLEKLLNSSSSTSSNHSLTTDHSSPTDEISYMINVCKVLGSRMRSMIQDLSKDYFQKLPSLTLIPLENEITESMKDSFAAFEKASTHTQSDTAASVLSAGAGADSTSLVSDSFGDGSCRQTREAARRHLYVTSHYTSAMLASMSNSTIVSSSTASAKEPSPTPVKTESRDTSSSMNGSKRKTAEAVDQVDASDDQKFATAPRGTKAPKTTHSSSTSSSSGSAAPTAPQWDLAAGIAFCHDGKSVRVLITHGRPMDVGCVYNSTSGL